MKSQETAKVSKSLKMSKLSFDVFKSSAKIFESMPDSLSAKKFGFVGSMPDCLTVHFVQEDKKKGIMKLKQVILNMNMNQLVTIQLVISGDTLS